MEKEPKMEIIAVFLSFIVILLPIIVIIGLIKPSILKQESRAKIFFGCFGIAFILVIIIGIISPKPKENITSQKLQQSSSTTNNIDNNSEKGTNNVKPKLEFSFLVEDFIDRYNQCLTTLKSKFKVFVEDESINNGTISVQLQARSTEHIGLIIFANIKTRNVQTITFIGTGDGSVKSGFDILIGALAVVMSIENPNMPISERSEILKELGLSNNKLSEAGKIHIVRKNVKYNMSLTNKVGTWLIAEPVK